MATEILVKSGQLIVLADTTDHSPTAGAGLVGTRTDQIDLTSLAAAAYRQSTKFDFTTPRANRWMVRGCFEWSVAPTAGGTVDVYIGFSDSATAANNNPGNLSGADGAWNGYGAAATDADEVVAQLDYVGSCVVGNDADIQIAELGIIVPKQQYGNLVVRNNTDQAFIADAVEMSVHLMELIEESQ